MKTYNNNFADSDKVELVLASLDNGKSEALKWAKQHKFPWPTVLKSDIPASGMQKYAANFVPHYVLIDKDGKKIAEGYQAAMAKAKSLSK